MRWISRMNKSFSALRLSLALLTAGVFGPMLGGCCCTGAGRPCDHQCAAVSTPSADAIAESGAMPKLRYRDDLDGVVRQRKSIAAATGSVTHGPLWFEDPREDYSEYTCNRRLPAESYGLMFTVGSRWMLNLAFLPVSAVVDWPWRKMESDGVADDRVCIWTRDASPLDECPLCLEHCWWHKGERVK